MSEGYEIAGDEPRALVDELIERVLAVGARFTPVDRRSLIFDFDPVEGDVFAVALHCQLLEIGWKPLQVLLVGKNCHSRCVKEIGIPDAEETHEDRKILSEGGGAKMLVHLMKSG